MSNPEKFDPEEAKRLIESAELEKTEAGQYLEKEPLPDSQHIKEKNPEEQREAIDYIKSLNEALVSYLRLMTDFEAEKMSEEEISRLQQDIEGGNYSEITELLKQNLENTKYANMRNRAKDLLGQLVDSETGKTAEELQKALDALAEEAHKKLLDRSQKEGE